MPAPPIPDNAFLTVTDLGGSSKGGGPHTVTSATKLVARVNGQVIDLGPYLTRRLKTQTVGSDTITFELTIQTVMKLVAGTWDWNSVDVPELWWWYKAWDNESALSFVYRPDSDAAAGPENIQVTVHIPQIPDSPPIPGTPDTPEDFAITIAGDYIQITDGTSPIVRGTSLA